MSKPPAWGAPDRRIWSVVLLFLIGIIAYADRQVIALVKPVLDHEFGWRPQDYGAISAYSQIAIACSLLVSGWIVDRIGPRWSLGGGLAGWSAATMLHAAMRSIGGFIAVRFALGFFEGVGTPALMRAVAGLYPRENRAAIIGVLNAAPNVAAMVTPLFVSVLVGAIGWRGVMLVVGSGGLLLAWLWIARSPRIGMPVDNPRQGMHHDAPPRHTGRIATIFATSKTLTDPVWWFLLFWLPDFLAHRYNLHAAQLGVPLSMAYAMATLGSILGGSLPNWLARRGLQRDQARQWVLGIAALAALPLPLVLHISGLGVGVTLCGLTLATHQIFAANLFSLVAERQPEIVIGRTTGIGAFCGNMAGALMLYLVGEASGHLAPIFAFCAITYVATWVFLSATVLRA